MFWQRRQVAFNYLLFLSSTVIESCVLVVHFATQLTLHLPSRKWHKFQTVKQKHTSGVQKFLEDSQEQRRYALPPPWRLECRRDARSSSSRFGPWGGPLRRAEWDKRNLVALDCDSRLTLHGLPLDFLTWGRKEISSCLTPICFT